MAFHCARYPFSLSSGKPKFKLVQRNKPAVLFSTFVSTRPSYNTLVSEAVRILVPPARFEASKLEVIFTRELNKSAGIIPRTYILSHCDFTANLTLTISDVINLDQLRGWYNKDDVVAEWKKVKDEMCLHIHCYVSGPNTLIDLAAEFRYHIFSKELPLVLESILYGDSILFNENPELLDATVRVFFHSSSQKYNQLECWGPLREAVLGQKRHMHGMEGLFRGGSKDEKLGSPKSIFQTLFTFLL